MAAEQYLGTPLVEKVSIRQAVTVASIQWLRREFALNDVAANVTRYGSDKFYDRLMGNRSSKRYTRTFVSTRAATSIKFLSPPAPIPGMLFPARSSAPTQPFCRLIEQTELRFSIFARDMFSRWNNPNCVTRRDPSDLVTRVDIELISNRLWQCYLVFRRDLRHILTLARMESLFRVFGESVVAEYLTLDTGQLAPTATPAS